MAMFSQAINIILLALGFGFVIFWHELGHFLAAKGVGVKVDQFAVGFGKAIFSWRKGVGFRAGSTKKEYDQRVSDWVQANNKSSLGLQEQIGVKPADELAATRALGLGETEYRLNWLPLGGYVKMLGQDDLDPNAKSEDPRSFNNKSIGARMVIVSAGVIMNVILAMIGFAFVFRAGFDAPPAVVGSIIQGSPAQKAGLEVGDRIAELDGSYQYDFTKLAPNVALAGDDAQLKLVVQKYDGSYFTTTITPERQPGPGGRGFLEMGVGQPAELVGPPDSPEVRQDIADSAKLTDPQAFSLAPGDKIIAINGKPLEKVDTPEQIAAGDKAFRDRNFLAKQANLHALDVAIQTSHGQPVNLTVVDKTGQEHPVSVQPAFQPPFAGVTCRLAGMAPRSSIQFIDPSSPMVDKFKPGDIVEELSVANSASAAVTTPTIEQLKAALTAAGERGDHVNLTVIRDGKPVTFNDITTKKLEAHRYGLNVGLDMDVTSAVVGDVAKDSPAYVAGISRGATITAINDKPVKNWFEIKDALAAIAPGQTATIKVAGVEKPFTLPPLNDEQRAEITTLRYALPLLPLQIMSMPRQTSNPITAAAWGVTETKDMLLQFYVSLHRMFDGSVPVSGMMGPLGIFKAGTGFAKKGDVWLLWFLSMISANLAVVNFLPIPIVDGGLFTFLLLEKLRGKPLSEKAHTIAQVVGLSLLGFVLVFATWQDIFR